MRCEKFAHLDVSSLKLIRITAVNDDELFHQMIKLTVESCHHLRHKRTDFIQTIFIKKRVKHY